MWARLNLATRDNPQGCRPQGATKSLKYTAGQLVFGNVINLLGKRQHLKTISAKVVSAFSENFVAASCVKIQFKELYYFILCSAHMLFLLFYSIKLTQTEIKAPVHLKICFAYLIMMCAQSQKSVFTFICLSFSVLTSDFKTWTYDHDSGQHTVRVGIQVKYGASHTHMSGGDLKLSFQQRLTGCTGLYGKFEAT